jgi:hypothetical protein
MATTTEIGTLQRIDGEDVQKLYPRTFASAVNTDAESTVQAELDGLKTGVIHVVGALTGEEPDGLYFVTEH